LNKSNSPHACSLAVKNNFNPEEGVVQFLKAKDQKSEKEGFLSKNWKNTFIL
jgi:hypothetical protein